METEKNTASHPQTSATCPGQTMNSLQNVPAQQQKQLTGTLPSTRQRTQTRLDLLLQERVLNHSRIKTTGKCGTNEQHVD